ncbi:MAG: Chemotaxis protein CheA, partial [Clostridium butyricum DORA_1]
KMEDVLSEFREGELKVTQDVVTVLFDCLDTLEKMVDLVQEGSDEKVDIESIMAKLAYIKENGNKNQQGNVIEESNSAELKVSHNDSIGLDLNEYDISVIKQAHEKGFNAVEIKVTLSENTLLKSARAFLIVKDLEDNGEILKSVPSTQDIRFFY